MHPYSHRENANRNISAHSVACFFLTGPHTFAARSSLPPKAALPRSPPSVMTQQKRQFLNFLVVQVRLPLLQGSALAASSAAFKTYSIVGSRLLLRKPCSARLSAPAQSKKLAHKLTPPLQPRPPPMARSVPAARYCSPQAPESLCSQGFRPLLKGWDCVAATALNEPQEPLRNEPNRLL